MKKSRMALVIVFGLLIALSAGLAACGGGNGDDPIVGKWTDEYGMVEYEFKSDGTLVVGFMGEEEKAQYSVQGGKLSFPDAMTGEQLDVDYKVEGDKLIMTFEGEEVVLVKK